MCLLLAGINLYDEELDQDLELVRRVREWEKLEDENVRVDVRLARSKEASELVHNDSIWVERQLENALEEDCVSSNPLSLPPLSLSSFSLSLSLSFSLSLSLSLSPYLSLRCLPSLLSQPPSNVAPLSFRVVSCLHLQALQMEKAQRIGPNSSSTISQHYSESILMTPVGGVIDFLLYSKLFCRSTKATIGT